MKKKPNRKSCGIQTATYSFCLLHNQTDGNTQFSSSSY